MALWKSSSCLCITLIWGSRRGQPAPPAPPPKASPEGQEQTRGRRWADGRSPAHPQTARPGDTARARLTPALRSAAPSLPHGPLPTLFSSRNLSLMATSARSFSYLSLWLWNWLWAASSRHRVLASRGPMLSSSRSVRYASYSSLRGDSWCGSHAAAPRRPAGDARPPSGPPGPAPPPLYLAVSYCLTVMSVSSMVLFTSVLMLETKKLTAPSSVSPFLQSSFCVSAL